MPLSVLDRTDEYPIRDKERCALNAVHLYYKRTDRTSPLLSNRSRQHKSLASASSITSSLRNRVTCCLRRGGCCNLLFFMYMRITQLRRQNRGPGMVKTVPLHRSYQNGTSFYSSRILSILLERNTNGDAMARISRPCWRGNIHTRVIIK